MATYAASRCVIERCWPAKQAWPVLLVHGWSWPACRNAVENTETISTSTIPSQRTAPPQPRPRGPRAAHPIRACAQPERSRDQGRARLGQRRGQSACALKRPCPLVALGLLGAADRRAGVSDADGPADAQSGRSGRLNPAPFRRRSPTLSERVKRPSAESGSGGGDERTDRAGAVAQGDDDSSARRARRRPCPAGLVCTP